MNDLLPHNAYYAYEQENQQTKDDVLDQILTMTVSLNYELEMLRNLMALYKSLTDFSQHFHWWMPAAGLIEKDGNL